MIVPYFDEQIVDNNYQCHLDHIPHKPEGEKYAVPYVYVIENDNSLGAKYYCSSHLGEHGAFIRVGQTITFLQDDIEPNTKIVVFYDYDNPNVKSEKFSSEADYDEFLICMNASMLTHILRTEKWCVEINGKRIFNPHRSYNFENENYLLLILPKLSFIDKITDEYIRN